MKAYSYIRMSTEKQLHGDSLRRQLVASESYAEKHDLVLDTTYRDIGVSAFKSDNLRRGALGRFVQDVHSGLIPAGSHLLIENLDRLSRDQVSAALSVFMDLLGSGIVIVTLADGRVYTDDTVNGNGMEIMISIMTMSRGHEESVIKQKRVSAAWSNKRDRADKEKMTARAPGWLVLKADRSEFEPIPDRVAVVRRIFEEVAGGVGKFKLARRLNADGVKPFGKGMGWHPSAIQKLVHNQSVLGSFQPHRREAGVRVPVGDPLPNYFPAVIDDALFVAARSAMMGRRNGAASGRKGPKFSNLLAGLGRCGVCCGPMVYRNKGKGPKGGVYLVCAQAQRGIACENRTHFDYADSERAILAHVPDFTLPSDDEGELTRLRQDVARLTLASEAAQARAARLLDELEAGAGVMVRDRLREREREIDCISAELAVAEQSLAACSSRGSPEDRKARITALQERMLSANEDDLYLLRAGLADALRRVIDFIGFEPDGTIDVAVLGGLRAYRLREGLLVDSVNLVPRLDAPGGFRRSVFTLGCPAREARLDSFLRTCDPLGWGTTDGLAA